MTTPEQTLLLYAELSPAEIRQAQRRLSAGALRRIAPGVLTSLDEDQWPALVARERIRILAALFPESVIGPRNAFIGGLSVDGVMYLDYRYTRRVELPGLTVFLRKGHGPIYGDTPMMGRSIYFPSEARVLLENLMRSRRTTSQQPARIVTQAEVETRLITICDARGEQALGKLRDEAKLVAQTLGLARELKKLNDLIGAILGTREAEMSTLAGKGLAAKTPYDAQRLSRLEELAAALRATPLSESICPIKSQTGRVNFAFLESYFSNFIEGTEFEVQEARAFVLQGKPITERPKDSHDIIGVFRQVVDTGWVNQTMSTGEAVLQQLRERHADQMRERPEVMPGQFKTQANRAGNSLFVAPRLVRGTLIEASKILPTVPAGLARALFAMFMVSEIHPFSDGNGRLARLVMNAELSVVNRCRIIVPTLYREEYFDCLRVLTREGDPKPFLDAMQWIQAWTAAFDYEDLDRTIETMASCHAFERSRIQHKLLTPSLSDLSLHRRDSQTPVNRGTPAPPTSHGRHAFAQKLEH
ncbi:MAG: Fic family protein [Burkholderiaceae bacterium]|nr:Fic family protein [Burkholderiaceae bacterium]MCD8537483.1 Fic family protein [Burkholderiaceae bacterium]MCD8564180.1 Fic family protein [Burkholderiaceae bacterium]